MSIKLIKERLDQRAQMPMGDYTSLEVTLSRATEVINKAAKDIQGYCRGKSLLSLHRTSLVLLGASLAWRHRLWLQLVVTHRLSSSAMILGRHLSMSSGGHVVNSGTWRISSGLLTSMSYFKLPTIGIACS